MCHIRSEFGLDCLTWAEFQKSGPDFQSATQVKNVHQLMGSDQAERALSCINRTKGVHLERFEDVCAAVKGWHLEDSLELGT